MRSANFADELHVIDALVDEVGGIVVEAEGCAIPDGVEGALGGDDVEGDFGGMDFEGEVARRASSKTSRMGLKRLAKSL